MTIEIWRSTAGVSDDDFSLLTSVPDGPGGETTPDSPVVPYQLYIYKARRQDGASGLYSAWSPLVYARAPWPGTTTTARNPDMSTTIQNTNTGIRSKMGFGLEAIEGQPVKAQALLDRATGSPNMELTQITRKTLRNNVGLTGGVAGKATITGTGISIEPCPESITGPLCAMLGTPAITVTPAVAPAAGVVGSPGYSDLLFTDGFDQFTGTLSERRGASFFCFPGTRIIGINIKADPDSDEVVMFGLDTGHLNQLMYAQESDLGLDTAAFDTLLPPSPVDAVLKIAGSLSADSKTFDAKLKRGQKLRRGLVGQRGGTSHILGRSDHSADIDLYFSTEAELLRYFGQAQAAQQAGGVVNYPYGAADTILYVPMSLLLPMPTNAAGFQNQIEIIFPACSYKAVGEPVEGEQEIMQKVSVQPYVDPVTNTDLMIRVRNSKSIAAVTTFGVPLTAVPVNSVTAFHNP